MDGSAALLVALMSAIPFFEARYAIPAAITLGMPPAEAFVLGFVGNILPVFALLVLLEPVSEWLRVRSAFFERFFTWLFARTRRHSERFEVYGALALIPFVAVPLPVTGAWTASAAAFVFGIRFRYALPTIAAGILIASAVTTLITIGVTGAIL